MICSEEREDMSGCRGRGSIAARKMDALLVFAFGCVLLVGVDVAQSTDDGEGGATAREQMDSLIARFWDWRLYESPEYASKLGLHRYTDRVQEFTEEAFARQKRNASTFLEKLGTIDSSRLDRQTKMSRDLLRELLATFVQGYDFRKYGMYNPVSSFGNPLQAWHSFALLTNQKSQEDFSSLIARYRMLPRQFDQLIALMRLAIHSGTTRHRSVMTGALDYLNADINADVKSTMLYLPFYTVSDVSVSSAEALQIQAQAERVLTNDVRPAIIKLRNFLVQEYLPHCAADPGVGSLPGGDDYYRAALQWYLSGDPSPRQLHELGLSEVDRISGLIKQEMERDGFYGSLKEYVTHLKNDPENYYTTKDSLLTGYRHIARQAGSKLPDILLTVPQTRVIVAEASSSTSEAAVYTEASLDGARPGKMLVNVFNPQQRPKFDMYALTLHEAEPGHHTQSSYAVEAGIPVFRRAMENRNYFAVPFNWLFHTAYIEGWAEYAKWLGEEMDFYSQPHALLGRYSGEIFKAARLVVDTGIHAEGWSRQQAISYMANHTTLATSTIEKEINRYISIPGQACAYKMGELKIKEFRKNAQESLGGAFDLRRYHDQILQLGPAPLSALERHLEAWAADMRSARSHGSRAVCSTEIYIMVCPVSIVAALVALVI